MPSLLATERRRLGAILIAAIATLVALIVCGLIVERQSRTPLIQVGQPAPEWTLSSADHGVISLASQRGRTVVLAFVPSVHCELCIAQLRAIQASLPELRARGAVAFAISVDLPLVQRTFAHRLGLDFPLLSEAPAFGLHPVGSAYGVYHQAVNQPGPVHVNTIVVIDGAGVVRAVSMRPDQVVEAPHILALVDAAAGTKGGAS